LPSTGSEISVELDPQLEDPTDPTIGSSWLITHSDEHIRCQKNTIADLAEIGRSIKALGGTLRKDVDSLKKLKRKASRSVEEEDGSRMKRVRKHIIS
jgi:hypothetical protein